MTEATAYGRGARRIGSECGTALALAVVALLVLGSLVGTAFLVCLGELRVGRQVVRLQQASAAADAGAHHPLTEWDVPVYNRLQIGDTASYVGSLEDGTGSYYGTVMRLGPQLYLVTAEGESAAGGLRQRAGTLMTLHPLRLLAAAALDTRGPLELSESSRISGFDRAPHWWDCPPTEQQLAALRVATTETAGPLWTGCEASRCLEGSPAFESDSLVPVSVLLALRGLTLTELRAAAAVALAGGAIWVQPSQSNGICVTAVATNWGDPYDPLGPCGDYFPVVYSRGDLEVVGGRGQGVLVVEGDLTVSGAVQFFGVVIGLGRLRSIGSGSHLEGAVVAANSALGPQVLEGSVTVQYSSCAVEKALAGSGRGVLLRERSWLDVY